MALKKVGIELTAEGARPFLQSVEDSSKAVRSFGETATAAGPRFSAFGEVITGVFRHAGELALDFALKAGKALAGFGADSVNMAADFQATINDFSSVAGPLDEAGLSVEDFKAKFLELGAATTFSAQEAADAGVELVKGGVSIEAVMGDATQATLDLAAAGSLELAPAAEIVAKTLAVWGEEGVTATQAANLLSQAANASSVDVDELALGLYNAQSAAKTAGVDFEELVTGMALTAGGFASAAENGTSWKNMITRLQPATKPATEAMMKLGLFTKETGSVFYDVNGAFIGVEKSAAILKDAFGDLSEAERIKNLQTIFGNDAMGAANGLIDKGAEGYRAQAEAQKKVGDASAQAAKKNQGFKASVDALSGSFDTLKIVLGDKLLPILTPLVDLATDATNVLYSFAQGGKDTAAAVKTFHGNLTELSPTLGKWFTVLTTGKGILDDLAFIAGDIASRFGPLGTSAQNLINIFLRGQDTFANWNFLARSLTSAFGPELGGTLNTFFLTVQKGIDFVGDLVFQFEMMRALGAGVGEAFLGIGKTLVDTFGPSIMAAIPVVGEALADVGGRILEWAAETIPQFRQAMFDFALVAAGWVLDSLPMLLGHLGTFLQTMTTWAVDAALTFGEQMLAFGQQAVAWIGPRLPELADNLGRFLSTMVVWVVDSLPGWIAELQKLGTAAIQWVTDALPGLSANLGTMAGNLLGWIGQTAIDVVPKLFLLAGKFLAWVATDVMPMLPGVLDSIAQGIINFIVETGVALGPYLADLAVATYKWVTDDALPGMQRGLESLWSTMVTWVTTTVANIPGKTKAIGTQLIQGITEGVKGAVGGLVNSVVGALGETVNAAKNFLGIQSPSWVGNVEIGQPFIQGITEGVRTQEGALLDAVMGTMTQAMDLGEGITHAGSSAIQSAMQALIGNAQSGVGQLAGLMSQASSMAANLSAMISAPARGYSINPVAPSGGIFGNIDNSVNTGPSTTYAPVYNSPAPPPAMSYATLNAMAGV